MADVVDVQTRSRMMASIRNKNTSPELVVRRFLHALGFRYRLHCANLPGKPDIVLPKYKVAVFVNGCFWHRHSGCRLTTTPAQNAERWAIKFAENVARDKRNRRAMEALGWRTITIWECGLRGKFVDMHWIDDAIKTKSTSEEVHWP